ncbi:MAG TPA: DUF1614 domain-containing protein [Syntrophomonadaceae bacterium]|nr:DUF1614 domain-containing protein [Syntrophomonadaceae bacterium]
MQNFPFGLITLVVISILIYFGIAHRALDRLRLSDKGALAVIAAIIVGSFFDIPISSRITINLGGVIAVGLAIWLWIGAGTALEKTRSIIAAVITALALFLAGRYLGAEPEAIFIDPIYIYPIVAGIVGYLAGRSRRGAFFAAVMGVFALDFGQFYYLSRTGLRGVVHVGGAGAFDSLILAGILAILLAELVGETRERLQGGPQTEGRPEELIRNLREPEPARKPQSEEKREERPEEDRNDEGGEKDD